MATMATSSTVRHEIPRWFVPLTKYAPYKGAYGGRGSGKTTTVAAHIVMSALRERRDVACLRQVQRSLRYSSKKVIEEQIESLGFSKYFTVKRDSIECINGSIIIFDGLSTQTAESIKSLQNFGIIWMDEAQCISEKSLEILFPTIKRDGSEIYATWNPYYANDPIEKYFISEPYPGTVVVKANWQDNPWLPDRQYQEMLHMRARDYERYLHIWEGEYIKNSELRVFKNWVVEEFETHPDAMFRYGADWGFSVDPTVLVRCYIMGRKLYIDYEAYQIGCEIIDLPALFSTVPESARWPITADRSRPETISHLKSHGYPKMMKSFSGPVDESVEWLQSYDIVVHPRCVHTIDELTHYSYVADPMTGQPTPRLRDSNNHVIDAIRYACEGARKASKTNFFLG
jgi:phage terminase large subunit